MKKRGRGLLSDIFSQADLPLLILCSIATVFGIVMIASATNYMQSYKSVIVQAAAACLGFVVYFLISLIDLNALLKHWKWMVAFNFILLALLLTPLGMEANGNKAWLGVSGFPVSLQPAEIVKITFIILLAKQLDWLNEKRNLRSIRYVIQPVAHLLILIGFYCVISSDVGSALVYIFAFACMAFVAGMAIRWFVVAIIGGCAGFYVLWDMDLIPTYMKMRFRVLLDHTLDTQGVGWHQTRSMLALGGGKIFGQGLFNGTQTQSPYSWSLPARHTDFIFSVIGEELGLVGCVLTIALLAAIVIRILMIGRKAATKLEAYICMGIAATLIFQCVANIGMCLFVMPVIGLTLPFISYGGSSLVTMYMAMGVVSGVKNRIPPEWLR